MATLTYFTCKLHYMSVVRHEFDDADADPEVKGINAGVTITAFIQQPPPKGDDVSPDEIQAGTLAPDIAMVVLVPVDCRLDNGELMLRADPDLDVDTFNSLAGFPATGLTTKLYRDRCTPRRSTAGPARPTSRPTDFAPVRLVAQTAGAGPAGGRDALLPAGFRQRHLRGRRPEAAQLRGGGTHLGHRAGSGHSSPRRVLIAIPADWSALEPRIHQTAPPIPEGAAFGVSAVSCVRPNSNRPGRSASRCGRRKACPSL